MAYVSPMPKHEDEGTFHGGFVRNRGEGRGVRVAMVKPDELANADPRMAQERVSKLSDPTLAMELLKPVQARKTKLACLGIPSDILDQGNELYARCIRQANSYKRARTKELFLCHGYVSSGVHSMLATASLSLAASRFLFALATNSEALGETVGPANTEYIKSARGLSDSARQSELSAWELCAKEAVLRRRNELNNASVPWMTGQDVPVKRGPGRPRKLVVQAEETAATVPNEALEGEDNGREG